MKLITSHYKDLLDRFDTHVISRKSISGGNHYTGQIREFLCFLEREEIFKLKRVNDSIMKSYSEYLITRPKKRGKGNLSVQTINDNFSTLRLFSKRMVDDEIISKGLPVPKNFKIERDDENEFSLIREVLTMEELAEVYDNCQTATEKALIALAYGCALRRGSLVSLEDSKIDFQNGLVTALKAKGNKTYSVALSDFFLSVLKDYSLSRLQLLADCNIREKKYFIDAKGKPYSGDRLNKMLKEIIARTKNEAILKKGITLHCLRHSAAVHLMDDGNTFEYIKSFLGHAYADTSMIYAKRRKLKNVYAV